MSQLPEPLRGIDGGFTKDSIAILAMIDEMQDGKLVPQIELIDTYIEAQKEGSPEKEEALYWKNTIQQHVEKNATWWDAPWFVVEAYSYRRLMQIIEFFSTHKDPFETSKTKNLHQSWPAIEKFCLANTKFVKEDFPSNFVQLVQNALWGNKSDLSLHPHGVSEQNHKIEDSHLLINHMDRVSHIAQQLVGKSGAEKIDIILDNAGFELFSDLCLCDGIVQLGVAKTVTLHCKAHPTFVSDALEKDVTNTISEFQNHPNQAVQAYGNRWRKYLEEKKWILSHSYYWNSADPFWAPSPSVLKVFQGTSLIFIKGDANYRRCHGDLHFPPTFPTEKVSTLTSAFGHKIPLVLLRTNKSGVFSGMSEEVWQKVKDIQGWCTSGEYGIIQVVEEVD